MRAIEALKRERHRDPLMDLTLWLRASRAKAPIGAVSEREIAGTQAIGLPSTFVEGMALADRAADEGIGLILISADHRTPEVRSLIGLLTSKDAARVAPEYAPHIQWRSEVELIAHTLWTYRLKLEDIPAVAIGLGLSRVDALAGVIIASAARRTPVLLDGIEAHAAALVAQRLDHRCTSWMAAVSQDNDNAVRAAYERLNMPALLGASITTELAGATLALAMAQISALMSTALGSN